MGNNWITKPIEDCMDAIIDYRGKTPKKTASGVPLVTAKIIKRGTILPVTEYIAEQDYNSWMRRGIPHPGDVVMTTEAPLGEIAQLDTRKIALAQRVITLRGKSGELDNTFLKYLMLSTNVQNQLIARSTGTTVKGIKQAELREVELTYPEYSIQRRIADILGTLDDKIELNRRMNETLEAMARRLFKSWFVDFDPVRAKATLRKKHPKWTNARLSREALPKLDPKIAELFPDVLVDSELGEIPEGWRVGTVGDIAKNPKRTAKPHEIEPDTPYIALNHMPRRCLALADWEAADGIASGKYRFNRGEILFGKLRPYFHKVGIAPVDGVCSTDILVFTPIEEHWFGFVLGHTSSDEMISHTNATSTGTRMPRTNWNDISRFEIALPSDALAKSFNEIVNPSLESLASNIHESRSLTATRDRLLPKLLSGELEAGTASQ